MDTGPCQTCPHIVSGHHWEQFWSPWTWLGVAHGSPAPRLQQSLVLRPLYDPAPQLTENGQWIPSIGSPQSPSTLSVLLNLGDPKQQWKQKRNRKLFPASEGTHSVCVRLLVEFPATPLLLHCGLGSPQDHQPEHPSRGPTTPPGAPSCCQHCCVWPLLGEKIHFQAVHKASVQRLHPMLHQLANIYI